MTKTIKIQSKREFLYDTPEHHIFGTYAYLSVSSAVKLFTEAAFMFNDGRNQHLMVDVIVKYTDAEQAKIKLKGERDSVRTFLNRVIAETELFEKFDIRL